MIKKCLYCSKVINKEPCWTHKYFSERKFCNKDCAALYGMRTRVKQNCLICGKETSTSPSDIKLNRGKLCSPKCRSLWLSQNIRGINHHNWKGGKYIDQGGYRRLIQIHHPRACCDGYVLEHILIAEKHLNRFLKDGETVHHINKDTSDNRPENLYLFSTGGEHTSFHHSVKRGDISGDIKSNIIH